VKKRWMILSVLVVSLLLTGVAVAANGHSIDWWTIGGGGGSDATGGTTLDGTVGQAVVGTDSNGAHELCAGFWCGTQAAYRIYLPMVLRDF
jgi:hypothetical protein